MVLKSIAGALSPSGPSARLSILIFHRVLAQVDPLFPDEPDAMRFDKVLSWIARWFQVMPLDEAVSRLRSANLPARAVAITFDDGYADNATIALPVLERHGMSATFFIATSFLDGGRMWNDSLIETVRAFRGDVLDLRDAGLGSYEVDSIGKRRVAIGTLLRQIKYLDPVKRQGTVALVQELVRSVLPHDLMMSARQVIQLRQAGMQIGAHTRTHPILSKLPDAQVADEIRGSKDFLESLLQEPVDLFAYPNGKPGKDYLDQHAQIVRQAGFIAAVSTAPGVASIATDPFQLPRFTPWDSGQFRYGMRMIANLRDVHSQVA